MLTKEDAIRLGGRGGTLFHRSLKNKDGTALRARVNGKCKTWKRDPKRWELPMKHGMRNCFRIHSDGQADWHPSAWTEVEPLSPHERRNATSVHGLVEDTPLPILRDALIDSGWDVLASRLTALIADGQS